MWQKMRLFILPGWFLVLAAATGGAGNKRLVLDEMDYDQRILALETTVQLLVNKASGMSTTYVRWGRSDCPGNGTQLVYKGFVGGNHYTSKGGAVSYLCLPDNPTWANYNDQVDDWRAYVYGTEYEMQTPAQTVFGKNMHNDDATCAVCMSSRPNVLMIPARNRCYPGWTEEYSGYLMAMYHDFTAHSDYVCVDADAEKMPHGGANLNGHLMYMVEGRCGSLACPPYVEGREFACVVCSK